jgi:hypothetical protein
MGLTLSIGHNCVRSTRRQKQNPVSETLCVLNKRWIMSRIVIIILIYHRHKPIDSINLLGLYRRRNVFPVRYGQNYRVVLSLNKRQDDG